MSTIYIVSDYGRLVKKGDTLQLRVGNDILKTVFPFKTEQIIVIGQIEITSAALRFLMRHHIDTVFLSTNGRFNGRIDFQTGKNIFLRKRQYELLTDENFCLSVARSIVRGKLKNQLTFVMRSARKSLKHLSFKRTIEQMKQNLALLEDATSVDAVRGYEGNGARLFFSVFKHAIIQDWAVFNGRSMHPPRDNVNAVLSFLYTMILFRVDAAIAAEQLDSYAGFFHSLDYGKKSLAFDLMEEYRTPIADTLTAALFNLGTLKEDDFREEIFSDTAPDDHPHDYSGEVLENEIVEEKRGVLLTKSGLRKVITRLERKLDNALFYPPLMRNISYRQLIHEQIKHFRRVMLGQEAEYKPLTIK